MPDRKDLLIGELESRVRVLEQENMLLTARSEDIFLLGSVVESITGTEDFFEILENTLERVCILKDIPYAACCRLAGKEVTVLSDYFRYEKEEKEEAFSIWLSDELRRAVMSAGLFCRLERPDMIIRRGDETLDLPAAVFVPFTARALESGFFLFGGKVRAGESGLQAGQPLLERVVEAAVTRLNVASLVAELQQMNAELDDMVHERTRELEVEIEERRAAETLLRDREEKLRESLREKEVLLKEVHHRVKNNLQVVSGLLNLQAGYVSDRSVRDFLRESQGRVRAMALIHEELYQISNLARVDLGNFIGRLTGNLSESYEASAARVQFRMEVQELKLAVDTVLPCALIINELVSNSLKHAFSGQQKGEISIRFAESGHGRYVLEVRDNGRGLPEGFDAAASASLGMRLIHVLSEQLGGEYTLVSDHGTRYSMVFGEYTEAGTVLY